MTSKRERYERANMRGGLGVRKRLSEDSLRTSYRLNGVQTGSVVVRAWDKYRGDFTRGFDVGVLVRRTASTATIHWHGDEEPTSYSQGDARYEVDRGRWRFLGIVQGNPLDPHNPLADALTKLRQNGRMLASDQSPTPPTEETEDMDKQLSKAAQERELAQAAASSGKLQERDTYTAKQVATRCGTDSKTMRKFFRSNHSTIEPVGQGGRYEFDARDLPKIKREFDSWQSRSSLKKSPTPKPTAPLQKVVEEMAEAIQKAVDEDVTMDQLADAIERAQDEEPTPEELAELEGLELDYDLDED